MSKKNKNSNQQFNRQGVRNLDKLPGKSAGYKLAEIPPDARLHTHKFVYNSEYGCQVCECGESYEGNW